MKVKFMLLFVLVLSMIMFSNYSTAQASSTQEQLDDWARHVTPQYYAPPKPAVTATANTSEVSATASGCTGSSTTNSTSGTNEVSATASGCTGSTSTASGSTGTASGASGSTSSGSTASGGTTTVTTGGTTVSTSTSGGSSTVVSNLGTGEISVSSGSNEVSVSSGSNEISISSGTTEITAEQHTKNINAIRDIYKNLVKCDPDVKLLNFLVNAFEAGAFTKEQIISAIKASDEYKNANKLRLE